jgi:hypothetical protein
MPRSATNLNLLASAMPDATSVSQGSKLPPRYGSPRNELSITTPKEPMEIILGEMPLSPGDLSGAVKLLARLDNIHPRALRFVRELFGQSGPGVRKGVDMKSVLEKIAPSAKLTGGTLEVAPKDVDRLTELFRNMGAPEGLRTVRDFLHGRNVKTTVEDAQTVQDALEVQGRMGALPIGAGGSGGPLAAYKPLKSEGGAHRGRPTFYDPDTEEAAAGLDLGALFTSSRPRSASQEFIDFLRSRTPERAPGTFLRNISRMEPGETISILANQRSPFSPGLMERMIEDVQATAIPALRELGLSDLSHVRRRLMSMETNMPGLDEAIWKVEDAMRYRPRP